MPSRSFALVLAVLLFADAHSFRAAARRERHRARREDGTPLRCLHVALVDSSDRAVAHAVTDSIGTFVIVAPTPGAYRVGFEIFGWERLVGPVDTLRDGELRERAYPLDLRPRAARRQPRTGR